MITIEKKSFNKEFKDLNSEQLEERIEEVEVYLGLAKNTVHDFEIELQHLNQAYMLRCEKESLLINEKEDF